jgi:hypothetical protein
MGEIMRWRLTREPQRRVPSQRSILQLGGVYEIAPDTQRKIQSLQQNGQAANNAAFTEYSKILADVTTLRRYLTTGNADVGAARAAFLPPVIQALIALLELDQWLASTSPVPPAAPPYSTPSIAALNQKVNALLGQYLPNTNTWQTLRKLITELLYAALVFSVIGVGFSLTEVLGLLTRLILVVALVDDLQPNPSPIQTPDDVYAALRWRTPVLPDWLVLFLLAIRLARRAVIVRKPSFADLYITREEWDHYEPAEIASIENVLKSEVKSRIHILVNQTQVTTTTEQITTQLKEQDTTTTDLTQLQQQSSSDITIAAHIDGQVNTSGQYGSTQVNTHLGGSLDYSNASATSKAMTQSHETVSRAVTKIEQSTRQIRTVSTLTREKDKEEHKFDNTQGEGPVVGIYRWVDQIQNVELDRYPHRFLMEFETPEPGAWTRWLQNKNAGRNMINQPPIPLTLDGNPVRPPNPNANPPDPGNPPLQPSDITADNYGSLAARYRGIGTSPPLGPLTVAVNTGQPKDASGPPPVILVWDQSAAVSVPNGYGAADWTASLLYTTGGEDPKKTSLTDTHVDLAVGAGVPVRSAPDDTPPPWQGTAVFSPGSVYRDQIQGGVGPISQGDIPVTIQGVNLTGFEVTVEVRCTPLDQTVAQWRNDTYGLIVGAYNAMLQAYNDEKAGLTLQQTNAVDANSPDQNAATVKQELKRQVIEMLTGKPFLGKNAISWGNAGTGTTQPTTLLSKAASVAPEVQFLEQALEWETLSYICYPYYWADSSRWPDLAVIEGNDSDFADFLRAGSARVVLAARPGFEDQVNFYVVFGVLWGGGPMPAPGDPDYLSIADEIKAQQQRPIDVTVIDTWQVRLPTTLIWLMNENPDGQLPKNPSPTIDTTPRITALSPNSGSVGDSVTIAGRNFGDIEGSSTASFDGTAATPTRWSATSIDVTVPDGAATGDLVVTVNGVASNRVNFTVD